MSKIALKGMTWNHPRGYDPMVACSRLFEEQTGTNIHWERRSLQDFESYPVEELARAYDLIVIDHPHVGQITNEKCLTPLDVPGREAEREALRKGSLGASYQSYFWDGRQWAFPIDAATQVQAYRPDRIVRGAASWQDVLELARKGQVLLPLRPPHTLMSFYTLSANRGHPCRTEAGQLIDLVAGAETIEMMREITDLIDPECFEMDPIAVLERMAIASSRVVCAPLIYGYINYSIEGFRDSLIKFSDIPATGDIGPAGSALGGTGIAVSAFSNHLQRAIDFAYWISSADIQRSLYTSAGGQAGHSAAWEDDLANAATANFYRATRATLESAWVRPRHDGYMAFQQLASDRLNEGLKKKQSATTIVADLNRLFGESFAAKKHD
ncbi:extracellular solute-binding protein [Rhizobium sp. No.120]